MEELFSYDFAGNRTSRKKGSADISNSYDARKGIKTKNMRAKKLVIQRKDTYGNE